MQQILNIPNQQFIGHDLAGNILNDSKFAGYVNIQQN